MAEKRRVLVVAAHPDDEILGAAGTMAMHARAGDHVSILILGGGEESRGAPRADAEAAKASLAHAAHEAAGVVGAELLAVQDLPDNAFDSVPLLKIVKLVEAFLERTDPDAIYTHHAGDLNIDHQLTCRAVITGSRAQGGRTPDIYSFEVRSATDYGDALPSLVPFRPNVWRVLDAEAVAAKMLALKAYSNEMRAWPHSRSMRAVQALLEHRGAQVGVPAAEALMLLRQVR